MGNPVPSNQPLPTDHADQVQRSTNPGATFCATSRATSAPHEMSDNAVTTVAESASESRDIRATCRADLQTLSEAANLEDLQDHPMLRLNPDQQQALELLALGYRDATVCKVVKIHRGTLARWKTTHPRFIAELARRNHLRMQSSNAAACRARDAALKIVLTQLRTQPKKSLDIAVRLLCSPQLTRLTASARPVGLQDILAQLQSTRPSNPADEDAVTNLLNQLTDELAAPEPPAPAPQPPKSQRRDFKPIRAAAAGRPIRQDLRLAMAECGCTSIEFPGIANRPDLLPFDVHYYAAKVETRLPSFILCGELSDSGPAGIYETLQPELLARMFRRGRLTRLASLDLSGASVDHTPDALVITTPDGQKHAFSRDMLWRDFVLGYSSPPPASTAITKANTAA